MTEKATGFILSVWFYYFCILVESYDSSVCYRFIIKMGHNRERRVSALRKTLLLIKDAVTFSLKSLFTGC